jgi:rhodanese-related sulfurtransferase
MRHSIALRSRGRQTARGLSQNESCTIVSDAWVGEVRELRVKTLRVSHLGMAAVAVATLVLAGCAGPSNLAGSHHLRQADNTLFGKEMGTLPTTSRASLMALSQRQCMNPQCEQFFDHHLANINHKALAIPVAENGVGASMEKAGPTEAFLYAVYYCNHVQGAPPRPCEVQTVNGKDIRAWNTEAVAGHRQALARLTVPTQRFFADEDLPGKEAKATTLRTRNTSSTTPLQIEGVTTVYTQDLARALKRKDPPLVIDVDSSSDVIPQARSLYLGGLAFDDVASDRDYEHRFAGLMKLLSPDMKQALVFYCRDRDCWFAVNAALRAKRLGYAQVAWYRGGITSWKAAGLPVATAVVKAVAHPP